MTSSTTAQTGATRAPRDRHGRGRVLTVAAASGVAALALTAAAALVVRDGAGALPSGGRLLVTSSARQYTAAGLTAQAEELRPDAPLDPTRAESVAIGPIGTPAGILDCLDGLGAAVPRGARVVADIARYQGRPAVVVVVDDGGTRRAWVTERVCTAGRGRLAGPVTLSSPADRA